MTVNSFGGKLMFISACAGSPANSAQAVLVSEWNPGQATLTDIVPGEQVNPSNSVEGGDNLFPNRFAIVDATTSGTSLDKAIKLDIANWSGATSGVEDDVPSVKRFYMLVSAGSGDPFP